MTFIYLLWRCSVIFCVRSFSHKTYVTQRFFVLFVAQPRFRALIAMFPKSSRDSPPLVSLYSKVVFAKIGLHAQRVDDDASNSKSVVAREHREFFFSLIGLKEEEEVAKTIHQSRAAAEAQEEASLKPTSNSWQNTSTASLAARHGKMQLDQARVIKSTAAPLFLFLFLRFFSSQLGAPSSP